MRIGLAAFAGALAAFAMAAGCAGPMRLSAQWTDPAFRATSLRQVMVIGVARDPALRQTLEQEFVRALAGSGVAAIASGAEIGDSTLQARALERGVDALLITRPVDARLVQANYPSVASYLTVPSGYASGWYAYTRAAREWAAVTGDTLEGQPVRLEANLYRIPSDRLVWSSLSESFTEHSASMARDFGPAVTALEAALKPKLRRARPVGRPAVPRGS